MNEINGFKIDKYNQYGLDEGVKKSTCPLCSSDRKKNTDKCLQPDWETGLAYCHHCQETIQLHTFEKKKNIENYSRPKWKNETNLPEKVVKYFEKRLISQDTINKLNISYGKEFMSQEKKEVNTIQFNYWRNGELINIKYRDGKRNFKLHTNAELILYNIDAIRISDECLIAEGEPDCMSFIECGYKFSTSVPNGADKANPNLKYIDNSYDWLKNKKKIYICLDNDEPGRVTTKELIRRLGAERCYLVDLKDCNDANDYLIKYGASMLKLAVKEAKQAPLENVIQLNDVRNELIDFYRNGMPKGYQIGLSGFDEIFSTYTQQYVVVTGVPSHGKTHFVDQMAIGYNINYDWKVGYCSVESNPKVMHMDVICRKIFGSKFNHFDYDDNSKEWQQVTSHVNDNFFFIDYDDGYDLERVLAKGAELVARKGIRCLVIDPFNKVRLKKSLQKNITEYTTDYLNEVDTFCRKHDCLVLLVAHPKKPQGISNKDYEPGFYDIKGGGEFYDMSPHGICIYRDFERDLVKVKVLKVKFSNLGENNAEVWFKWNPTNTRFTPLTRQPNDITDLADYVFSEYNLLQKEENKELPVIDFDNEIPEQLDEVPF